MISCYQCFFSVAYDLTICCVVVCVITRTHDMSFSRFFLSLERNFHTIFTRCFSSTISIAKEGNELRFPMSSFVRWLNVCVWDDVHSCIWFIFFKYTNTIFDHTIEKNFSVNETTISNPKCTNTNRHPMCNCVYCLWINEKQSSS